MSFAGRLVHRLAIVTPGSGDPEDAADLSPQGQAEPEPDTVSVVWGLVQPRTTAEVAAISQAGLEMVDHVIFFELRDVPQGSYVLDAPDDNPDYSGRRFDVIGVRSFEFGRSPHLEVDCRLFGRSEGPAAGS